MPKRVNHQECKTEILQVFLTCAAIEGLQSVTLRGVAAQAGISLRQIQYYFGTQDALVQEGLHMLEQRSHHGFNERLSTLSDDSGACTTLITLFEVALRIDAESRQQQITEILAHGIKPGGLHQDLNAEVEAIVLLGLINGLEAVVLLRQQTAETTITAFTTQVNRLR
jgi:DNA-binding transcriptional regulator YbjK